MMRGMSAKHSPGPWTWDEDEGEVVAADERVVIYANAQEPFDQYRADMQLIAAAPEMLALLREARPMLGLIVKAFDAQDRRSELCKRVDALFERLEG